MIVTVRYDILTALAYKHVPCPACGTRAYAEWVLWQPLCGDPVTALAALLERVAGWKAEAVCCERCAEREAVA